MTKLPQGWCEEPLVGLCSSITTGRRPKGGVRGIAAGVLSIGGEHVSESGCVDISTPRFVPEGFVENIRGARVSPADVLIVKDGATTGKVAIADERFGAEDAYVNEHVFLCRVADEIDARYVFYFLRSAEGHEGILSDFRGAAQGGISRAFASKVHVPTAPRCEQQRIVAKLDDFFARSRRMRSELDRVPVLVDHYKHAILAAAFRGDLTVEWRTKQEDSRPIRVPSGGKQGHRRSRISDSLERFSAPYELPEAWQWVALPRLGELARGKSRHRPRNDPRLLGGPYPFVQTGDVRAADGVLTEYSATYSDFGLSQSRLWPKGTVCITIAANIAETAILGLDACFPDSVVGFLANDELCSNQYIEYFIRTAKTDLEAFAPATAQKNINLNTLSEVFVPVPPREEQGVIVARIDRAFEALATVLREARIGMDRIGQLERELISKAFRGELVPQDANDESASILLERIRAKRAVQPKARGGDRSATAERKPTRRAKARRSA